MKLAALRDSARSRPWVVAALVAAVVILAVAIVALTQSHGSSSPPGLVLSPSGLSFGDQPTGTTSDPQDIQVSGHGVVTAAPVEAVATGDFSASDSCPPAALPGGQDCPVSVVFHPSSGGVRTGVLTISDGPISETARLVGIGVASHSGVSPSTLSFGNQGVGTTSAPQVVTVSNQGDAPLAIGAVTTNGPFAEFGNCNAGSSLQSGQSCAVQVTFTPTAAGPATGALAFAEGTSTATVSLSGTGVQLTAGLSTTSLTFGSQGVGTFSGPQDVVVTDLTAVPLALSGYTITSDFKASSTCPTKAALAPQTSCVLAVRFGPTALGTRTGQLVIATGAGRDTVTLTGVGSPPQGVLSPSALTFGAQPIGVTGPTQQVVLTNAANAPLSVAAITLAGDFADSTGCPVGGDLGAGSQCTITVSFTPMVAGGESGLLTVAFAGGSGTVALSGTGIAPSLSLTPAALSFPATDPGTTSAAMPVTVTNSGSSPALLARITVTGDFSQTNDCARQELAPQASCTVNVTFAPTGPGAASGTLTVIAAGGNQTAELSGTAAAPSAALSPTSGDFGDQVQGAKSAPQTFTLTNSGTAPLNLTSITTSGDFSEGDSCATPGPLAPGASCVIHVSFTPTALGPRSGTLIVTFGGGSVTASLSGTGIR